MEARILQEAEGMIKEYAKAPREMRIDPTFCPTPRMHSWEAFAHFYASNPYDLNWLVLPTPLEGQPITKTWFVEACSSLEEKLKDIPNLSCQMLCKFMCLFKACLETFRVVKKERTDWSRYVDPDEQRGGIWLCNRLERLPVVGVLCVPPKFIVQLHEYLGGDVCNGICAFTQQNLQPFHDVPHYKILGT